MVAKAVVMWADPVSGRSDVIELLEKAGCSVVLGAPYEQRSWTSSEDELLNVAPSLDGIMVGGRDRISSEFLRAAQRLIVVSKRGIGVDKIAVKEATDLGILVTNTPVPGHRTAVAEYAVGLMFGVAKQLHLGDQLVRAARFDHPELVLLKGKTIGIIGYGQIGRRVAHICTGLGMTIISFDPYVEQDGTSVGMEELLSRADVVSLHASLSDGNRHLLDQEALGRMKPGAILVNTARGGLVDEAALAAAIREGRLGGAGLNVFEQEPPPPDSPILADDIADRVLVTPHGAGQGAPEIAEAMPRVMAEIHLSALSGKVPESSIVSPVVNPEVLSHWRGNRQPPLAASGVGGSE